MYKNPARSEVIVNTVAIILFLAVCIITVFLPKISHSKECVQGGSLGPGESCTSVVSFGFNNYYPDGLGIPMIFDREDAIKSIIGEAEDQDYLGMLAVACALRNRNSFDGVQGINSKRVEKKLYSMATYEQATKAWDDSEKLDITQGANHWYSTIISRPKWAKGMKETLRYKKHVFYKEVKK